MIGLPMIIGAVPVAGHIPVVHVVPIAVAPVQAGMHAPLETHRQVKKQNETKETG